MTFKIKECWELVIVYHCFTLIYYIKEYEKMKEYTIEPGKHAQTWMVKLEGILPANTYDRFDDAMFQGRKMARENRPSKLIIYDKFKNIEDELTFK